MGGEVSVEAQMFHAATGTVITGTLAITLICLLVSCHSEDDVPVTFCFLRLHSRQDFIGLRLVLFSACML